MSMPSTVMRPLFGFSAPVTRLMVVVLPEPFGPIRLTISPRRSVNDMSCTAAMPPKCLFRLETFRMSSLASVDMILNHLVVVTPFSTITAPWPTPSKQAVGPVLQNRIQPVLGKTLHQNNGQPQQHVPPLAGIAQHFGQHVNAHSADDRPRQADD